VLNLLAPHHGRQGQRQRQPEAAAEHLDAVAGVLVVGGMLAGAGTVAVRLPNRLPGTDVQGVPGRVRMAGILPFAHARGTGWRVLELSVVRVLARIGGFRSEGREVLVCEGCMAARERLEQA